MPSPLAAPHGVAYSAHRRAAARQDSSPSFLLRYPAATVRAVLREVDAVLYKGKDVRASLVDLLARESKDELTGLA